ncbi:MAG: 4Fe-4S dicluster domain-containing protein [Dehalococcoidia bacterium]|jgi:molybdopterin-containing oxidoreductase family iron-sulfur binding subunit|nr:MAG: 4Fe-4S dicluster domain-containing protein [Dehalococcoidia bacterium]
MAKWGMVIDLGKCTGCQSCSVACKAENDVPHGSPEEHQQQRAPFWHKVFAVSQGEYPTQKINLIPMPCMHCEDAPCIVVCPAKATYHREDGIVIQNFRRCIGCRYCIVACPYGVRNFNFKDQVSQEYHRPDLPLERTDKGIWPFPQRVRGVVEKCTFCFHRIDQAIREGKKVGSDVVPACAEACPARAISFGDIEDPNSEVSRLLATRGSFRLREEMKTEPKVFYLYG